MKKLLLLLSIMTAFSCTTIKMETGSPVNSSMNHWAYLIVNKDITEKIPEVAYPATGNLFYDEFLHRADLLAEIGIILKESENLKMKKDFLKEAEYHINLLDKLDPINDFRGKYSIRKAPEVLKLIVKTRVKLAQVSSEIKEELIINTTENTASAQ
jgi:hypothetical protein